MRKNSTRLFVLMLLFVSSQITQAQTLLWPLDSASTRASQFADTTQIFKAASAAINPPTGFAGWTSRGVSSGDPAKVATTHWDWTRNGKGDKGTFWGTLLALASPSVANGCAIFNSDYLSNSGLSPSPHVGELISPAINATGSNFLAIEFNQYFRNFQSRTWVQYSNDGGTTWSKRLNVYPNIDIGINNLTNNTDTVTTKVRMALAGAVGGPNFRFKFVFDGLVNPAAPGQSFYYWIIDDVKLYNHRYYDAKVNPYYAIPPVLYAPKEQLDTVRFLADIIDLGSARMNNPKLQVRVWKQSTGALVFSTITTAAQYPTGPMPYDSAYENRILPGQLLPAAVQAAGQYVGSYRVIGDSSAVDFIPSNDTIGFKFWVSDTSTANSVVVAGVGKSNFTKEDLNVSTISLSNTSYWTGSEARSIRYGNPYRVNAEPATITSMIARFNPFCAAGRTILGSLYEWNDANGDGDIQFNERILVAAEEKAIPANVANANAWWTFKMTDFNTNGNFYPKAKKNYLAMIEFDAPEVAAPVAANYLQMVINTNYPQDAMRAVTASFGSPRYGSILGKKTGDVWSADGIQDEFQVPVIRLNILPFRLVANPEVLKGDNKLTLSPNPVGTNNFVNIDVQLEKVSDALLRVMTIDGKMVAEQVLEKFEKQNIRLDVSEYSSGTYILQIYTPEGIMSKKFVKVD